MVEQNDKRKQRIKEFIVIVKLFREYQPRLNDKLEQFLMQKSKTLKINSRQADRIIKKVFGLTVSGSTIKGDRKQFLHGTAGKESFDKSEITSANGRRSRIAADIARSQMAARRPDHAYSTADTSGEQKPRVPTLEVIEGDYTGEVYPVLETLTIGRGPKNNIRFKSDYSVSRHHARLIVEGTDYYIEDLQSSNGTYVNDVCISKIQLADADEIQIGESTLLFRK